MFLYLYLAAILLNAEGLQIRAYIEKKLPQSQFLKNVIFLGIEAAFPYCNCSITMSSCNNIFVLRSFNVNNC